MVNIDSQPTSLRARQPSPTRDGSTELLAPCEGYLRAAPNRDGIGAEDAEAGALTLDVAIANPNAEAGTHVSRVRHPHISNRDEAQNPAVVQNAITTNMRLCAASAVDESWCAQ